jgi:hypothetical protein
VLPGYAASHRDRKRAAYSSKLLLAALWFYNHYFGGPGGHPWDFGFVDL